MRNPFKKHKKTIVSVTYCTGRGTRIKRTDFNEINSPGIKHHKYIVHLEPGKFVEVLVKL